MDQNLEDFIQQFSNTGTIDNRDEIMIAHLLLNPILKADVPGEYGMGYSEDTVLTGMKNYFNVDIDLNRLNIPTELDAASWIYRQNDAIFLCQQAIIIPK